MSKEKKKRNPVTEKLFVDMLNLLNRRGKVKPYQKEPFTVENYREKWKHVTFEGNFETLKIVREDND